VSWERDLYSAEWMTCLAGLEVMCWVQNERPWSDSSLEGSIPAEKTHLNARHHRHLRKDVQSRADAEVLDLEALLVAAPPSVLTLRAHPHQMAPLHTIDLDDPSRCANAR
jgi:hypothetical protein